MKYAIAIDLGGTSIKGAVIDQGGEILLQKNILTKSDKGQNQILENIFSLIAELREQKVGGEVVGVGVGVAGPTKHNDGVVLHFPNLSIEDNFPMRDVVAEKTGLPTTIHNDANAAMYGEVWKGAAKNSKTAILLTLGTGIGGGVVVNGEVFDGGCGVGAELGHVRLGLDGPECSLGTPACFEAIASAPRVTWLASEKIDSKIKDSKEVFDLAEKGNQDAIKIWEEVGGWIGIAVGNYLNIFNPEIVLIGGDMSNAWKFFEKKMLEEVKRTSYPQHFGMCKIEKAVLGNSAGVLGMAHAVFEEFDK